MSRPTVDSSGQSAEAGPSRPSHTLSQPGQLLLDQSTIPMLQPDEPPPASSSSYPAPILAGTSLGLNGAADPPPPTTAGPSSDVLIRPPRPRPAKGPSQGLSLNIPPGNQAYGGLTPVNPDFDDAAPPASAIQGPSDIVAATLRHNDDDAPPNSSLLRTPKSGGRKRPARLNLATASLERDGPSSKSVPSSPIVSQTKPRLNGSRISELSTIEEREKQDLRSTLTGKPRRRPSMPFGQNVRSSREIAPSAVPAPPMTSGLIASNRVPEAWRDPSEHILSGKGSTLQHARSVYAAGPIEVLPGLFLGDEHNARDDQMLGDYGITTILNVAKETVLPFQSDEGATPLREGGVGYWATGRYPSRPATNPRPDVLRNMRSHSMAMADTEEYFTPMTSRFVPDTSATPMTARFPEEAYLTPSQQTPVELTPTANATSHLLRNTLSTPNLQTEFKEDADVAPLLSEGSTVESTNGSSRTSDAGTGKDSPCSSSTEATSPSECSDLDGVAASKDGDRSVDTIVGQQNIDMSTTSEVTLPEDAIKLTIPPSPVSGRPQTIRYIKLPWTHDQSELASANGGFTQGCAVIAEALGIDRYGRRLVDGVTGTPRARGNILVHCQCGVSRSATLVIAFVMQSAAYNYPWEETKNLNTMHECYDRVKDLSSSISPNISLIYQLVEWERFLVAEVARLREAFSNRSEGSGSPSEAAPLFGATAWSGEALNEAEWTRMRLEEERKEQAEEQERRLRVEEEAQRQAEARRKREEAADGEFAFPTGGAAGPMSGLSARRRKRTPSLQLPGSGAHRSSSSSDDSADATSAAIGIPSLSRRASDFAISSSNSRPLPSASLFGSFPGRSPVNGLEEGADAAYQLTKTLPSLALRSTHASIVEEDELSPRSALPHDTDGPMAPGANTPVSFPAQGTHATTNSGPVSPASQLRAYNGDAFRSQEAAGMASPPITASPEMPRFPGAFPESATQRDFKSPRNFPGTMTAKAGSRPSSFHASLPATTLSSASSTSSVASFEPSRSSNEHGAWSSTSSTSMKPSRSSGPTSTISRSSSSGKSHVFPKNSFGAGSSAADEERKQRHRRTFSSEVNWEQVVKLGAGHGGGSGLARPPSTGAVATVNGIHSCNGRDESRSSSTAP